MSLRPKGSNPGQTYMWYTGKPVYEFGHGLFYTTITLYPAFERERSFTMSKEAPLLARWELASDVSKVVFNSLPPT
jgi:beta-D-xylosidase 4